jgi:pimeloyl-ACP methyl ester carboxylesterase
MKKIVKQALVAGALIAGPALINNAIFSRAKALGNTLGGEGRFWPWREGDVFYTRCGSAGNPILFLHGIYAGASIYEWRKNFKPLADDHEVTALDWLGFGLSDKPKIRFSHTLYIELLRDFIREVIGRPCTVIASSLAGAYAIEAAAALPELVSNLVLVCPTGFNSSTTADIDPAQQIKYAALTAPLAGTSLYNAITSRASMRAYLQSQIYFDPSYVTDEMIDHYSTATHQYGSQYAPLSFIAGELGHTVSESFPKLTQSNIRLIWGREAKMTPLSEAEPFLSANPNAEITVIDKAGLLPHDEQSSAFNRLIRETIPSTPGSEGEKPKKKTRAKKSE